MKEIKTRVPLRVMGRKNLPRFGEAREGEENVTLPSRDFVPMEHPEDAANNEEDDPTMASTLANFIAKQQERGLARELGDVDESEPDHLDVDVVPASGGDGKYIPPSQRGGRGSDARDGDREKDGTENTIRVSNLTKAVTEDDLRDLFERFGRIHRVSLPRIERDGVKEPRGFAYIAFARREDAEVAMSRLQGYGYDHLIIKLEWAKPTQGGGGGGDGGGETRFRSGYGKQLVQDTTDKVLYASNLTGNS